MYEKPLRLSRWKQCPLGPYCSNFEGRGILSRLHVFFFALCFFEHDDIYGDFSWYPVSPLKKEFIYPFPKYLIKDTLFFSHALEPKQLPNMLSCKATLTIRKYENKETSATNSPQNINHAFHHKKGKIEGGPSFS